LLEPVYVFHVVESMSPDVPLHVMCPKPVQGELVDGRLASAAVEGDPLQPLMYDGEVRQGPGIDTKYEISTYRFLTPGKQVIQWQLGPLRSNMLTLIVES
jgi:hypothetical protein